MADLTGATILKDDELETVISKPKKPVLDVNFATRDQYPGMSDDQILEKIGADTQAQMVQEDQYREPQQVAPGVTQEMLNQSLQGFQKAAKPSLQQKISGQPITVTGQTKKPIAPPAGKMPETTSAFKLPEMPKPEALKAKGEEIIQRGADEEAAYKFQAKEAALEAEDLRQKAATEAVGGILEKKDYVDARVQEAQDELDAYNEARLLADEQQKKINDEISKKIANEGPEFYERTLGNRIGWMIATFVAGLGGKGESVLRMLDSEIERKAKLDAQKIASMAKMYKPSKAARGEEDKLKKTLQDWQKQQAAMYTEITERKLKEGMQKAKSPEVLARYQDALAMITQKKANQKVQLEKDYFTKKTEDTKRRREEDVIASQGQALPSEAFVTPQTAKLKINVPGTKISFVASTEKGAEELRTMIPSSRTILGLYKDLESLYSKHGKAGKLTPKAFSEVKSKMDTLRDQLVAEGAGGGFVNTGVIQPGELPVLRSVFTGGDPNSLFKDWKKTVQPSRNFIIKKLSEKLNYERVPKNQHRLILGY